MDERQISYYKELHELLLVGIGAIPGAFLRWQLQNDLLVNIFGSFILGLIFGMNLRRRKQLIIGVGFCGALTTFGGWILSCFKLMILGSWFSAFVLIFITLGLGLGFAYLGLLIGRKIIL